MEGNTTEKVDDLARQIGSRLRTLRTERKLSSRKLAELIGTTQQAISSLERGTHRPSLRVVEALAKTLNVRPIEIFIQTPVPTPVNGRPSSTKWDPEVPIEKQIGKRILDRHWESRMTQLTLAAKAGINNSRLCAIESGKALAKLATLNKIANALNVTLEYLFDFDEPKRRHSHLDQWAQP